MISIKTYNYQIIRAASIVATLSCVLLFGASPAQAAYEIYTYGSGDFVARIFAGVALLFSGNRIQALVKVVLIVGLLVALLNPIMSWLSKGTQPMGTGGDGFIAMLRQVLLAAVVVYLFITPKAEVAIIDRIDPAQSQVVGDVPIVQAVVGYGASVIGDTIGEQMETAFSLPGSLRFREGGLGLGIKYIDTIFNIQPPSSNTYTTSANEGTLINQSLKEYFNQCVFPQFAVLDGGGGTKTAAIHALANDTNIINALNTYSSLFADPTIPITVPSSSGTASCAEAIPLITTAWTNIKMDWYREIETKVSGNTTYNPSLIGTGQMTQDVLSHYFPLAGDSFAILQNIAVGNLMRDAAMNYGAIYGNKDAVADTFTQRTSIEGWRTAARMFSSIVHVMRNIFEGLVYGLSVLLPVAVAVAGLASLVIYVKVLLWLQLWVPFYVLLNLFADMEMSRALGEIANLSNGNGPNVKTWQDIGEKAQLSLAYLGSLSFVVPTLAWGLIKGGEYAVSTAVHAMSSGSGSASIAATTGGQVAGMGNVNVGHRNIGNDTIMTQTPISSGMHYGMNAGTATAGLALGNLTGKTVGQMGYESGSVSLGNSLGSYTGQNGQMGIFNTSRISGEISKGSAEAKESVAMAAGYKSVESMIKDFTTRETTAAIKAIDKVSEEKGITRTDAARLIGDVTGTDHAKDALVTEKYYKDSGLSFGQIVQTEANIKSASTMGASLLSSIEHGRIAANKWLKDAGAAKGEQDMIKALGDPHKTQAENTKLINTELSAYAFGDKAAQQSIVEKLAAKTGKSQYDVQQSMAGVMRMVQGNAVVDMGVSKKGTIVTSAEKSGFSSVRDDSNKTLSGTSSVKDDTNMTLAGSHQKSYNDSAENVFGNDYKVGSEVAYSAQRADIATLTRSMDNNKMWSDSNYRQMMVNSLSDGLSKVGRLENMGSVNNTSEVNLGIGFGKAGIGNTTALQNVNMTRRDEIFSNVSRMAEKLANDKHLTNDTRSEMFMNHLSSVQRRINESGDSGVFGRNINTVKDYVLSDTAKDLKNNTKD